MFPIVAASIVTAVTCSRHGSWAPCPSLPTDPRGALTGPLSLAGHVADQNGAAVVGELVTLSGDAPASRSTDFAGGYLFHPSTSAYSLTLPNDDCSFSPNPASGTISPASGAAMQNVTATRNDCATAISSNASSSGSLLTIRQGTLLLGTTKINIAAVTDANAAGGALNDIAAEITAPACSLAIAGKPAIERRAKISPPAAASGGGSSSDSTPYLAVTTAIALDTQVVRFESQLDANAPANVVNRFVAAGRAFVPADFASP